MVSLCYVITEDDTTKQYTTSKSDSQGKHISPSGAQDSNATSVAHKSDAEEAQLLMAQVKKEAKVTMLNSAKKQAESARDAFHQSRVLPGNEGRRPESS